MGTPPPPPAWTVGSSGRGHSFPAPFFWPYLLVWENPELLEASGPAERSQGSLQSSGGQKSHQCIKKWSWGHEGVARKGGLWSQGDSIQQVPEGFGVLGTPRAQQDGLGETLWLEQELLVQPPGPQVPQRPGQTQGGWCRSSVCGMDLT